MGMLREAARSKIIWGALGFFVLFILAGALFNFSTSHPRPHPAVRTKTNATGLLQAIEGFHSTYDKLPQPAPTHRELLTQGEEGVKLLTVLLGKEEPGDAMQNKKQIRFLTVEETEKREKGGLLYKTRGWDTLPEGLYDSWGQPFHVRFAPKASADIPNPFRPGEQIHGKVAIIYSYGKDGKIGGRDDIQTW
jgi:hypothetical protein